MSTSFSNTDNIDLRDFDFRVVVDDSTHLLTEVIKQFLSCDDIFGCYMPKDRKKPLDMNATIMLDEDYCTPSHPKAVIDVYDELDFTIDCLVEDLDCNESKGELIGIEVALSSLLNKIKKGLAK